MAVRGEGLGLSGATRLPETRENGTTLISRLPCGSGATSNPVGRLDPPCSGPIRATRVHGARCRI